MAVTLTTAEVAELIRVDGADTEPLLSIVTELLEVAKAQVESFAPDAPDAIHNRAAALYAGYIYDSPQASRGSGYAMAMVNSGAAAVLSNWYSGAVAVINPT